MRIASQRSSGKPAAENPSADYSVQEVASRRALNEFIALPYRLYRQDPLYVPPLRSQVRGLLSSDRNPHLTAGPFVLLLCRRRGQPDGRRRLLPAWLSQWFPSRVVGRILVAVDRAYDQQNHYHSAWFGLFESVPDAAAATALFAAAEEWSRRQGADFLRGPEPPDNGDFNKGLLVMGFDGPPALMNSYNPPWYGEFFESIGFRKLRDLYAYALTTEQAERPRDREILRYAMDRYQYHVDAIDLQNLDRDLVAIQEILAQTVNTWQDEYIATPNLADIRKMADAMLPIADPDLIYIARTNRDDRPIGFVIALPDYNQVFRHVRDGRTWPFGIVRLLYYRRKITALRVMMQFVIPAYHKKAVNNAIFIRMIDAARAKGYRTGDGSTIGEANRESRLSVEKLGGVHYRTYREYKKALRPQSAAGMAPEQP